MISPRNPCSTSVIQKSQSSHPSRRSHPSHERPPRRTSEPVRRRSRCWRRAAPGSRSVPASTPRSDRRTPRASATRTTAMGRHPGVPRTARGASAREDSSAFHGADDSPEVLDTEVARRREAAILAADDEHVRSPRRSKRAGWLLGRAVIDNADVEVAERFRANPPSVRKNAPRLKHVTTKETRGTLIPPSTVLEAPASMPGSAPRCRSVPRDDAPGLQQHGPSANVAIMRGSWLTSNTVCPASCSSR